MFETKNSFNVWGRSSFLVSYVQPWVYVLYAIENIVLYEYVLLPGIRIHLGTFD